MFTGDRSGDWLFGSMHRTGYADHGPPIHPGDGLTLTDAYIGAAVRCAPPANKPTREERDTCLDYFVRELPHLARAKVLVALGSFAWDSAIKAVVAAGAQPVRPKPKF
ncbi:MAG: uracil-DNA glycosylase, partial [Actinomycetota bacterium]|nr:uracil-DNA glycosylase [Actinomycetota bacterium]